MHRRTTSPTRCDVHRWRMANTRGASAKLMLSGRAGTRPACWPNRPARQHRNDDPRGGATMSAEDHQVRDSANRFDAIVIGAGQAGPGVAQQLAAAGRTVALLEADKVGGTCLNRGCRPTKALRASAR